MGVCIKVIDYEEDNNSYNKIQNILLKKTINKVIPKQDKKDNQDNKHYKNNKISKINKNLSRSNNINIQPDNFNYEIVIHNTNNTQYTQYTQYIHDAQYPLIDE
jgi:hypothetical protein